MKAFGRLFRRKHLFALIIGFADGILTALTLTAGSVIRSGGQIDGTLALRVPVAASLSGAFVFFVAEYGRLRGELIDAERQLNLTTHGRFAALQLGRAVLRETMEGAAISCLCSFLGALLPLIVSILLPGSSWLAIAIAALGGLGVGVAQAVYGNPIRWAGALITAGILLTCVGAALHLV